MCVFESDVDIFLLACVCVWLLQYPAQYTRDNYFQITHGSCTWYPFLVAFGLVGALGFSSDAFSNFCGLFS